MITDHPQHDPDPAGPVWCDRCGDALAAGGHEGCAAARALEPPRFCPACRRRMKVQVLPTGWHATCTAHGPIGTGNAVGTVDGAVTGTGGAATAGVDQPRSPTGR